MAVHLDTFGPDHPVARVIREGDRWFGAWIRQKATPIVRLSKLTGIPGRRLLTIDQGDRISRAELDALARAWCITSDDLLASIADPDAVIL